MLSIWCPVVDPTCSSTAMEKSHPLRDERDSRRGTRCAERERKGSHSGSATTDFETIVFLFSYKELLGFMNFPSNPFVVLGPFACHGLHP